MAKVQHVRNVELSSPASDSQLADEPTSRTPWLSTQPIVGAAIVASFLTVVIGGSWAGLSHIKDSTRDRAGDALRIVVETTQESLRAWLDNVQAHADRMARDQRVIQLTARRRPDLLQEAFDGAANCRLWLTDGARTTVGSDEWRRLSPNRVVRGHSRDRARRQGCLVARAGGRQ